MPDDDEEQPIPERPDTLPAVTAMPAVAPPSQSVLQPVPDPAEGPRGFPNILAYQAAYDRAARSAAAEREQQDQFNRMLQQSARTEDSLKVITAAKRFIATRKLQNDFQSAVQSGLTPEKAWALSAAHNLEAFGGNLSPVTSAMRAARPAVPAPPLGEVIPVNVPGGRTSYGTRTGPNTMQLLKEPVDEQSKLEKDLLKSHINNLQKQADSLAMAKDKDSVAVVSDLNKQIEEGKRILLGGSAPETQKAMPMPKTKDKLEKGVVYQTPRGLARWNGEKFERVQ